MESQPRDAECPTGFIIIIFVKVVEMARVRERERDRIWPSGSEATILRLLIGEPKGMYGLQLVEASDGQLKRGTAYVTLGRMVEKGYLKVEKEVTEANYPGLPRPIYRLTGLGRKALEAVESMGLALRNA
jgi:DNA-binding PadR family transcriptional regulator